MEYHVFSSIISCYILSMESKVLHTSSQIKKMLIVSCVVLLFIGCRTQQDIIRTPEEIAFGEEAVKEMMALVVVAASDSFFEGGQWNTISTEVVPVQAGNVIALRNKIPGMKRLLDTYLKETQITISALAKQIPEFISEQISPDLSFSDPYAIIEGENDAITRYFAATVSDSVEKWIESQLEGDIGKEVSLAWEKLISTYNTYAKSQNLLNQQNDDAPIPIIDVSFNRTVTIAILRNLIGAMTTQEALLRTMAPAYEDPRITLFSSQ